MADIQRSERSNEIRELINIMPGAVCFYDSNGCRVAWTRRFMHRFGDDLLPEQLFAGDQSGTAPARLLRLHWQVLAGEPRSVNCGEVRIPRLNNYTRNCSLVLESLFVDGTFCGVVCTLEDHSVNLILDEQVRGVMVDRTVLFSRVSGWGKSILKMSENVVRLTGYTAEEFHSDPWLIFDNIHPDDMGTVISSGYMLEQHDHSSCEFRFRRRDGKYVQIREEARLLRETDEKPDRILVAWFDLTPALHLLDPKKAGREKDDSQFRRIVEEQTELICQLDDQFRFLYVNEAFCRYFSLQAQELLGKNMLQFIPVDQQQRLHEQMHRLTVDNPVAVFENSIKLPDGGTRWQQWVNRAVFDSNGELLRYQSIGREITGLKQDQLDREQLLDRLQEKNDSLQTVLRTISHDLSTPLANVRGYSQEIEYALEYLLKKYPLLSREQEVVDILQQEIPGHMNYIHSSVHRMELLLRSSLRFCRLGQSALEIMPLDMTGLFKEVLQEFHFQIKQAELEVKLEPLPECRGDRVFTGQIFSNLVSNAIRYRRFDRASRLHIRGFREQDYAVYCVEDNGIGIEEGELERIFQLFQQGTRKSATGVGIGLALVKELTERMGGTVRAESQPGEGSRFIVRLPLPVSHG